MIMRRGRRHYLHKIMRVSEPFKVGDQRRQPFGVAGREPSTDDERPGFGGLLLAIAALVFLDPGRSWLPTVRGLQIPGIALN